VAIHHGDDRRRIVPLAIVRALTALIDMEDQHVPLHVRVELRNIRSQVARLYRIADPMEPANSSALAQDLEDDDGVPIEE